MICANGNGVLELRFRIVSSRNEQTRAGRIFVNCTAGKVTLDLAADVTTVIWTRARIRTEMEEKWHGRARASTLICQDPASNNTATSTRRFEASSRTTKSPGASSNTVRSHQASAWRIKSAPSRRRITSRHSLTNGILIENHRHPRTCPISSEPLDSDGNISLSVSVIIARAPARGSSMDP